LFKGAVIALEFASPSEDICELLLQESHEDDDGDHVAEDEIYVSPSLEAVHEQIEHIFNASI